MDPEEIARRVANLRLSMKETERGVKLSQADTEQKNQCAAKMLVGKIFANRQYPRETLREKLPLILQVRGHFDVELVGFNIFVLYLELPSDITRIMAEGPWHIFNDLILIQKLDPLQSAATVEFKNISMWIQLHNLPITCMEQEMVRKIGDKVGTVLEIESGEGGRCLGKYARVRVERSIDEPLVRGIPITSEKEDNSTMVLILYERLPESFCFACGKIGHHMKNCDAGAEEKANPSFGNWLRAGRSVDYRRPAVQNGINMRSLTTIPRLMSAQRPNGPRPPPRAEKYDNMATYKNQSEGNNAEAAEKIIGSCSSEIRVLMEEDTTPLSDNTGHNMLVTQLEEEGTGKVMIGEVEEGDEVENSSGEQMTQGITAEEYDNIGREKGVLGARNCPKKISNKLSSVILKKKQTGKGWKRLARERNRDGEGVSFTGGKMPMLGKRKEKEKTKDLKEDKQAPSHKNPKLLDEEDTTELGSAAAALMQPRREQ
ncbi:uncharacterized protein LOC130998033 [Salvia miltiorrhiza]|uniref:uncharacterized protein LOC130998033 n=1 Tax=Salvia miltiorrhiza TaxID=226208 RepID=UPI0025AC557C|nr:uncharacterized protein LOC130998033 [Salvia miltiorrhiza]